MTEKDFYVYMLASKKYGVIYKGMTSDFVRRVSEHKNRTKGHFTKKFNVRMLVWYKQCGTVEEAVLWEKRLRRYPRQWKIDLIEKDNPAWSDLWAEIWGVK